MKTKLLRPYELDRKRKGLAGVLAGIIMFAAIFTTGFGFFLFVNSMSQTSNQANQQRANQAIQAGSEKLSVVAGLTSPTDLACIQCVWVRANNTGGVSSTIVNVYVTCQSNCGIGINPGEIVSNSCLSAPSHFLKPGAPTFACKFADLNITQPITLGVGASTRYQGDIAVSKSSFTYSPLSSPPEHIVVSVLTSKGNVFSAQYPPAPKTSTTFVSVNSQTTQVALKQIGGGPQLSVLMTATALCPGGSGGCTQTFSCSTGCVTVTATIYNLATIAASGVSLTLHTPYSDFVSGTASVSTFSACTPATQNIPAGGQGTVTCQFNAKTGATGGLASFSGYASGTLGAFLVTSAEALSNSIEIGGLASVTTQGAFAANFFFLKYSSCFQNTGTDFSAPCTPNVPMPPSSINNLPSGSFLAGGSNFYVAFYMQITNVFNTTLPILQYSYTFGDPTISGEVYYFLAGSNTSMTNGVYYPNYSSNPTLVGYPTDCSNVNANNVPLDGKCIYVDPGQTVTLTFAACGYGATNWAWGGNQDAQGYDSGTGCTGNSPSLSVPEGMSLGIVVSFLYKGQLHSQLMPFEGQAYLRSTATTVSCNPSPAIAGSPTTCTATVTDNDGSGTYVSPVGTVAFSGQALGLGSFSSTTCTLSSGSCSVTWTPTITTSGPVSMSASYQGDSYHISSSGTVSVNVVHGTSAVITCAPTSLPVNTPTTCTATITDTNPSPTTPTGTVTFSASRSGAFSPTSCILSGGGATATCTTQFTPAAGTESPPATSVTGTYNGDSGHATSTGSTTVNANQRTSSVSVTCAPSPVKGGAAATCTATVTDTTAGTKVTPTGTVSFLASPGTSGSFSSSTCTLSAGTCTVNYTPSVGTGSVSITATYGGDTDHSGSGPSTPFTLAITLATPTLSVSCSPNPVVVGTTSSCTATLTAFAGTVTNEKITWSQSGAGVLTLPSPATCSLSVGGTCSITVTGSTPGSLTLTAMFTADSNNQGASGSQGVTVKSPAREIQSTNLCINPGTSSCSGSLPSPVTSGDLIVIVVSTQVTGSRTCVTVSGISGNKGDNSYSPAPGGTATASINGATKDCAYTTIYYASVTSSGTDSITVNLSGTPTTGVVSVFEVASALTPPVAVIGTCTSGCSTSLATSSLSVPANSFVVVGAALCPSTGGTVRTIVPPAPSGFNNQYGTGFTEYVGFQVPPSSGSQTFPMTASGTPACWSAAGAEFPDPPASPPASPQSPGVQSSNGPMTSNVPGEAVALNLVSFLSIPLGVGSDCRSLMVEKQKSGARRTSPVGVTAWLNQDFLTRLTI